ncbi:hypothetical protein BJ944DRAFT_1600 [Cunninghamella echinulata]|nr:hypothetical protein BJ944DRAFT_1600 [Cunninghamella echinulata]
MINLLEKKEAEGIYINQRLLWKIKIHTLLYYLLWKRLLHILLPLMLKYLLIYLYQVADQSMIGGKIVYSIECCLDMVENDPSPVKAHSLVTVLEIIDVNDPKVAKPKSEECVCALWLNGTPRTNPPDYKIAMRAQLLRQACTRGGEFTIVIHVWHSVEFHRPKGVTVSLIRVHQLNYHGSAYAFNDDVISTMCADVDIKQEKKFVQDLSCNFKIPLDITPSISDSAKLLEVSYKVLIKARLQDGTYQTPTGDVSHFMYAEIPLLIGTVPTKIKRSSPSTIKAPISLKEPTKIRGIGSKDNDNGSVGSADEKKKGRSFGSMFGFRRNKKDNDRKQSKDNNSSVQEDDTLVRRYSGSQTSRSTGSNRHEPPSNTHHPTTDAFTPDYINRRDSGNPNSSAYNESQTSHTAGGSSPRYEKATPSTKDQQPFQITSSTTELKPDEKDDVMLDFELHDAIKRSIDSGNILASSTTANPDSTTHPTGITFISQDGTRTIIDPARLNISTQQAAATTTADDDHFTGNNMTSNKEIGLRDHKQDQLPQSPVSATVGTTTVASKNNNDHNRGDNGVVYHDIFDESSDEEDYDDYNMNEPEENTINQDNNNNDNNNNNANKNEDENQLNNGDKIKYHDIFGSDDDDDEEEEEEENNEYLKEKENYNNNNQYQHEIDHGIVKPAENQQTVNYGQPTPPPHRQPHSFPSSQPHKAPPSPPLHQNEKQQSWKQKEVDHDHENNSDSDDFDSSPLGVVSKQQKFPQPR